MHDPGPVNAIRSVSILVLVGGVILGIIIIVSARETIPAIGLDEDEIRWNLARITIGIAGMLLGALSWAVLQGFAAMAENLASIATDMKRAGAATTGEQDPVLPVEEEPPTASDEPAP